MFYPPTRLLRLQAESGGGCGKMKIGGKEHNGKSKKMHVDIDRKNF